MSEPAAQPKRVSRPSQKLKAAQEMPGEDELDGSEYDDVIVTAAKTKAKEAKAAAKASKKKSAPNPHAKGTAKATKGSKGGAKKGYAGGGNLNSKVSKAGGAASDDSGEEGSVDEEAEKSGKKIDLIWDTATTWKLVNAVYDDDDIRQGLFPDVGANVSTGKGGGKTKVEWHEIIARMIFTDHKEYGAQFAATANTPSGLKAWALKIKNRLSKIVKETVAYNKRLGSTGEGLQANHIDINGDNPLANVWQAILKDFPYFAEMRALIAARPNLTPVGLGNSISDIDMTVLAPTGNDSVDNSIAVSDTESKAADEDESDADSQRPKKSVRTLLEEDSVLMSEDDEVKPSDAKITKKRSVSMSLSDTEEAAVAKENKSAGGVDGRDAKAKSKKMDKKVKSSTSQGIKKEAAIPSDVDAKKSQAKSSKKKKLEDQFSTVAVAEETTRQRELDVAKMRAQTEKEKTAAKLQIKKAQIEEQRDEKRSKTELMKLRMEHKHQLKLERLRLKYGAQKTVPAQPGQVQGIVHQQTVPSYIHPDPTQGSVDAGGLGLGRGHGHGAFAGIGSSRDAGLHHLRGPSSSSFADFGSVNGYSGETRSSSPAGMSTHSGNSGFQSGASDGTGSDGFDLMYPFAP